MPPLRRIDEAALARAALRKRPAPKPEVLRPSSLLARAEASRLAVEADMLGVAAEDPVHVGPGEYSVVIGGERVVVFVASTEVGGG